MCIVSRTTAQIENVVCGKHAEDDRLSIDAAFNFGRNRPESLSLDDDRLSIDAAFICILHKYTGKPLPSFRAYILGFNVIV